MNDTKTTAAQPLDLDKLDKLEALARAATPGPWEVDTTKSEGHYGTDEDGGYGYTAYIVADEKGRPLMDSLNRDQSEIHEDYTDEEHYAWDELAKRDAQFIAAANPATVLALIAKARAAQPESATGTTGAPELSDAGIVEVLASMGVDSDPSKFGFKELQVRTTVPTIRKVVERYLAAPVLLTDWQPIETAPHDGRAILLSRPDAGGAWIGKYEPVYQSGYRPDNPWFSLMLTRDYLPKPLKSSAPTHWKPLPAAPDAASASEQPDRGAVQIDYTVDDSELARKIMVFMGRSTTQSMEPGADPLRDRLAERLAIWRPAVASSDAKGKTDADELHFNATRLRNVARLVGLESAVPQDDATLDGARGSVLGMIAGKLRTAAATSAADAKDAARYRFLRIADLDAIAAGNWQTGRVVDGVKFDDAIDAAMAAAPSSGIGGVNHE